MCVPFGYHIFILHYTTNMSKENKSHGFAGFLIGGAIGLAVGLLIAPEQGEKLRRKVAYRIKHLAGNLEELVERIGKQDEDDEIALVETKETNEEVNLQAKQLEEEMNALMNRHKRGTKVGAELMN